MNTSCNPPAERDIHPGHKTLSYTSTPFPLPRLAGEGQGGGEKEIPINSSSPRKTKREAIEAALLLLLALAVFFWPAVIGGRVLLPADLIFDLDPLWQPLAPEGFTAAANQNLSDQVYQSFSWKTLTVRSLARGQVPLWNPYINGGQPFVGNAQSAVFGLFNLIGYLFPLYTSYVVTAMLRQFVAGIFTFLFAREIGLGKPGAILAMLAFTFSGPMIGWLGFPLSSVIAWLPAMLWTIERALTRKNKLYVVLSGLAIAAQFLGGHPETSFHVMLAWGAYAVHRAAALEGGRLSGLIPHLLRIAAAAVSGALLAAVQLLPFGEALQASAILSARQAESATAASSFLTRVLLDWWDWPTALTAILPQYFGTPLDNSYWYPYSTYVEQTAYVGMLPLALAAAVTLHSVKNRFSSQRNLVLFFALLAGVCLGVAIGLPLLNVINYLPVFSVAMNGRLRLIYAFAVAILAGLGLDRVSEGSRDQPRATLRLLVLFALVSLVMIAITYVGFIVFKDALIRSGRAFMEANWGTPYFSRPLDYYYDLVTERYAKKLALFFPGSLVMYLPVLIAAAGLALYRWGHTRQLNAKRLTWVALGLTVFDVFLVGMPFNPTLPPQHVFPAPGAIEFLRQDHDTYRLSGAGLILNPNSGMVFGLSDIRGYESVVPARYMELINRVEGHFNVHQHSLFVRLDAPLLDLLNVKYILTDQTLGGRWELAYRDAGGVNVYRNRQALPRAFLVYRAEIVENAAQSLERVTEKAFDFRARAVLEQVPAGWTEPAEIPAAAATISIVDYEPGRVRIEVETAADGLLVLTDTFAPGWKATLDGRTTQVYIADHAFRAVLAPAGVHQVEFVYAPVSFQAGAAISLLTAVALVFALILSQMRRARGAGL